MLLLALISVWELALDDGATRVEKRKTPSGLYEFRATMTTDVAPERVANTFWNRQAVKGVRKYQLIKRTDTEKIAYVQLKLPVIKDRDYTVRMRRYDDAHNGLYQFDTNCESDLGPPRDSDFVRVTFCIGRLTIERDDGKTLITNVSSADPAGAVPYWMVNMLAPKAAGHFLQELVREAAGAP